MLSEPGKKAAGLKAPEEVYHEEKTVMETMRGRID